MADNGHQLSPIVGAGVSAAARETDKERAVSWVMNSGAEVLAPIGVSLVAIAVSMTWMLHPRGREETRIMQMPGAWIVLPLVIILCLLSGGGLIYTTIGR